MSFSPSNKIGHLIKILNRIDSGRKVNASLLAEELGVTVRTISRYFQDLQQAGYPIFFDRGRMTYRFVDGYRLKSTDSAGSVQGQALDIKSHMIGASSVGLISYDAAGRCVYCNDTICRITGGGRSEILSQNYNEIASWRDSGLLLMAKDVMSTGMERSGDFHIESVFGGSYWLHAHMSRFEKDGGLFLMLVAQDITERKELETATRKNEELLRTFIRHSPVYAFIKDEELRPVQISDNFEQLTGMPWQEMIGREMNDIFPSDFAEKIVNDDRAVLASMERFEEVEHFKGRAYHTIKFPFELDGRKFLAGYTIDITEQITQENELRACSEQFRLLASTTLDAFWVIDESGQILDVNDTACAMYGYTREELLAMTVGDIDIIEDEDEIRRHIERIVTTGYDRFETRQKTRDGTILRVEVSSAFMPGSRNLMAFTRLLDRLED